MLNKLFKKKEVDNYLLIGPPNVGKSTFFNKITWKISPVSNIDRFTTSIYQANLKKNSSITIYDLPGINSLNVQGDDQYCTMKEIIYGKYLGVLNICSINSLKRDLFLTLDLAEAGILGYLIINMVDEKKSIDIKKINLTNTFKVPVSFISAKKNLNINEVLLSINSNNITKKEIILNYSKRIENIIKECLKLNFTSSVNKRFLVIQSILGNTIVLDYLKELNVYDEVMKIFNKNEISNTDINDILSTRQKFINTLWNKINFDKVKTNLNNKQHVIKDRLNNLLLNPFFAIPCFLLIILGIYFITFYEYTGGYIQSQLAFGFESLQTIISDSIYNLNEVDSQAWWAELVANGLFGGIFTILSFLPWIIILLFLISILEQTGILSRMSIVLDDSLNKFGISGRSVINIITGIGCNVPSIILARNSNSKKEKIVSILISPFISCSARVIVFGYFANIIMSSSLSWILVFVMTIVSVIFVLFMGYFFSNLLFRKCNSIFLTEVVKFRTPDFLTIFKRIFYESYDFIKKTTIFVGIANLAIWILNYTSPETIYINPYDNQISDTSFLYYLSYPFRYILYPLGLGYDWRFSVSIISAFPAKEIVASNIETLFGTQEALVNSLSQHTILVNSVMLSFITFISFYIPCMATISVMKREIGWKYVFLHIGISLLSSYLFALFVFSLFGSIELLWIGAGWKYQFVLIFLILILFLICFLIISYLIKFILLKKNHVWTKKEVLIYKITMTIIFSLLFIFTIVSNILLFV